MIRTALIAALFAGLSQFAVAQNLFTGDRYQALVSDRRALTIGDNVTIVILEVSQAKTSNDASNGFGLGIDADYAVTHDSDFGELNANLRKTADESNGRTGQLKAQVSATVRQIDSHGKLFVTGTQKIVVNGEEQLIDLQGWLRPEDIDRNNVAVSTRLSDVQIEYTGYDAHPGFFGRLFSFLGF